jgi:hypothetical protein
MGWIDARARVEPEPEPVGAEAITKAEAMLGFPLPAPLVTGYSGFGAAPDRFESHLHLVPPGAVASRYLAHRTEGLNRRADGSIEEWPEHLLPVLDRGCGIVFCVLAKGDDDRVWVFDPNRDLPNGDSVVPWRTACTLAECMARLAKGDTLTDLWGDGPDAGVDLSHSRDEP